MIVVNWINKVQYCHNIYLSALLAKFLRHLEDLDSLFFRHVYRERNIEADKLLEKGLSIPYGKWKISEFKDGTIFEYYHRPFINGVIRLNSS